MKKNFLLNVQEKKKVMKLSMVAMASAVTVCAGAALSGVSAMVCEQDDVTSSQQQNVEGGSVWSGIEQFFVGLWNGMSGGWWSSSAAVEARNVELSKAWNSKSKEEQEEEVRRGVDDFVVVENQVVDKKQSEAKVASDVQTEVLDEALNMEDNEGWEKMSFVQKERALSKKDLELSNILDRIFNSVFIFDEANKDQIFEFMGWLGDDAEVRRQYLSNTTKGKTYESILAKLDSVKLNVMKEWYKLQTEYTKQKENYECFGDIKWLQLKRIWYIEKINLANRLAKQVEGLVKINVPEIIKALNESEQNKGEKDEKVVNPALAAIVDFRKRKYLLKKVNVISDETSTAVTMPNLRSVTPALPVAETNPTNFGVTLRKTNNVQKPETTVNNGMDPKLADKLAQQRKKAEYK